MSVPEALESTNLGHNIWVNIVYDLMTWAAKRPFVYSTASFPNGPPEFGPGDPIGVDSPDARTGAMFLEPPGIGADTMNVGDRLSALQDKIRGQKNIDQPGFVRGGMMAFQELLSTMTVRQRLAGGLLQSGGLESVYRQVLIYMQNGVGINETIAVRELNEDDEEYVSERTITDADLLHAYALTLDLSEIFSNGMMEQQNKIAVFDRKSKSPMFNQHQIAVDFCDSDAQARRQVLPRKVVERKQAAIEQAQMEATRTGAAGGPPALASEGAIAGALEGGV